MRNGGSRGAGEQGSRGAVVSLSPLPLRPPHPAPLPLFNAQCPTLLFVVNGNLRDSHAVIGNTGRKIVADFAEL